MDSRELLRMENISKAFPGVQALDNVNLDVRVGEILGLIGENGAGKSTLMKILSGVYPMDSGRLYLRGRPIQIQNPHHAQQLGISVIYQEFNLMPNLTVMENVFIGREPTRFLFVDRRQLQRRTRELLDRLGVHLSPTAVVRDLSVAEQQMVEIAKALSMEVQVIIMDEPTSALSDAEVQTLFGIMRELRRNGISIIFISHRLEEVLAICDRITVLRDGKNVGTLDAAEASEEVLIRMMVGRSLQEFFHKEDGAQARVQTSSQVKDQEDVVLEVRGITRKGSKLDPSAIVLDNVSFQLRRGEILGLAGLVGAGRTELARAIFGADARDAGEIYVEGKRVDIRSPVDAIRHGIGFVPEDRKEQGLILSMAVRENITLPSLHHFTRSGFIKLPEEERRVREYVTRLQIRTPSLEQRVRNLSGGNQQKVVISKWMLLQPKILIMDEPTRGIDVGTKAEIYGLMHQLARAGIGIIMISSELPELLAMSDRIVCMCEGRVTGVLNRNEATPERVMRYCTMRRQMVEEVTLA
ncbi:MAG: sugar ABC transporter ATP-binding protein [Anaerolineae bacterium]|nr:sugar ABC transporter ATP-binding protein [Anaerolineae bacterium]MDW8098031.1 sugar ABC transporter ATP-binding protein [Anaerolineae bacterium]